MIAYVVLLLAVISRLAPPMLHLTAMNFTAVWGSLLFFGAKRPKWQSAVAVAVLMATDLFLTVYVYHFAFHVGGYLVTWAWYGATCLIGSGMLQRVSFVRVAGGVLASATGFFVLSDFVVWLGNMYPHTIAGLVACYVAAIPFYRNDLVSTGIVAGALFGLPVVAARLVEGFGQPKTA
jgi:hypothetical protein